MEKVHLGPVDRENWQKVIDLSVAQDQKTFVASNLFSLAESKIFPELIPLAIYAEDELVGFCMIGTISDSSDVWVVRLMIDQKYQAKGYGRAAMQEIFRRVQADYGVDQLFISFDPENAVAEGLYASLGFVKTKTSLDGETVMRLDFRP